MSLSGDGISVIILLGLTAGLIISGYYFGHHTSQFIPVSNTFRQLCGELKNKYDPLIKELNEEIFCNPLTGNAYCTKFNFKPRDYWETICVNDYRKEIDQFLKQTAAPFIKELQHHGNIILLLLGAMLMIAPVATILIIALYFRCRDGFTAENETKVIFNNKSSEQSLLDKLHYRPLKPMFRNKFTNKIPSNVFPDNSV